MMAFCPEHPKWDQNPKFTPLSKITSIPTTFICGVPPPDHNDPQLITGWAHGVTVLRKWKNISPWNLHLNVRYLSQILNFTTDMTSKWITYRLITKNIKLSLALASDSRLPTSSYITLTLSSKSQFDPTRKHPQPLGAARIKPSARFILRKD